MSRVKHIVLPAEVAERLRQHETLYHRAFDAYVAGGCTDLKLHAALLPLQRRDPGQDGYVGWGGRHPNEVAYTKGWAVCRCGPAEGAREDDLCMSCGCRVRLAPDEWWGGLSEDARERVMGCMCHASVRRSIAPDEWWARLRDVELRETMMRLARPMLEHGTVS